MFILLYGLLSSCFASSFHYKDSFKRPHPTNSYGRENNDYINFNQTFKDIEQLNFSDKDNRYNLDEYFSKLRNNFSN